MDRTWSTLLWAALALAIGCGGEDRAPAGADAGVGPADAGVPDGGGGEDAGDEDAGGVEPRIRVGATDGTIELSVAVDIEAEGFVLESASLDDGVGTVRIDGMDADAFVYERIDWPAIGQTLYQTLAVSPDALRVLWFYCADGNITGLWLEGTDGLTLTNDGALGTCTETASTGGMSVRAPAIDMPIPELLDEWQVSGPTLSIEPGEPGWVDFGAGRLTVLPFDQVDCSAGSCTPGESWFELHTLLWDEAGGRVCFAIFYLYEDRDSVLAAYSITLPDLSDPAGTTELEATWTRM